MENNKELALTGESDDECVFVLGIAFDLNVEGAVRRAHVHALHCYDKAVDVFGHQQLSGEGREVPGLSN